MDTDGVPNVRKQPFNLDLHQKSTTDAIFTRIYRTDKQKFQILVEFIRDCCERTERHKA